MVLSSNTRRGAVTGLIQNGSKVNTISEMCLWIARRRARTIPDGHIRERLSLPVTKVLFLASRSI